MPQSLSEQTETSNDDSDTVTVKYTRTEFIALLAFLGHPRRLLPSQLEATRESMRSYAADLEPSNCSPTLHLQLSAATLSSPPDSLISLPSSSATPSVSPPYFKPLLIRIPPCTRSIPESIASSQKAVDDTVDVLPQQPPDISKFTGKRKRGIQELTLEDRRRRTRFTTKKVDSIPGNRSLGRGNGRRAARLGGLGCSRGGTKPKGKSVKSVKRTFSQKQILQDGLECDDYGGDDYFGGGLAEDNNTVYSGDQEEEEDPDYDDDNDNEEGPAGEMRVGRAHLKRPRRGRTMQWKIVKQAAHPCAADEQLIFSILNRLAHSHTSNLHHPNCSAWIEGFKSFIAGHYDEAREDIYTRNTLESIALRCKQAESAKCFITFIQMMPYVELAFKLNRCVPVFKLVSEDALTKSTL